jgi:hypothetical protein
MNRGGGWWRRMFILRSSVCAVAASVDVFWSGRGFDGLVDVVAECLGAED